MSTPMEWWDRRAQSAKVRPHKPIQTHPTKPNTPVSKVPLWSFLLLNPQTHTNKDTPATAYVWLSSLLQIYAYKTRKWHTPTRTPAILLYSLSYSQLFADLTDGSYFKFISVICDMYGGAWRCDHAQAGVCRCMCVCGTVKTFAVFFLLQINTILYIKKS